MGERAGLELGGSIRRPRALWMTLALSTTRSTAFGLGVRSPSPTSWERKVRNPPVSNMHEVRFRACT